MSALSLFIGNQVAAIDVLELNEQLKGGNRPFLLDVRQPAEYRLGHIAGAKLIPLGSLASRITEIPPDRQVVCICATGHRSVPAARMLISAGYPAVNMKSGMLAWMLAGLPVHKGMSE